MHENNKVTYNKIPKELLSL